MAKHSVMVYLDPVIYERFEKAKKLREKINRPAGKMSSSYYASYLIEEGLKSSLRKQK